MDGRMCAPGSGGRLSYASQPGSGGTRKGMEGPLLCVFFLEERLPNIDSLRLEAWFKFYSTGYEGDANKDLGESMDIGDLMLFSIRSRFD
jgi:hypothetical protein